jgi:hypothetical protein
VKSCILLYISHSNTYQHQRWTWAPNSGSDLYFAFLLPWSMPPSLPLQHIGHRLVRSVTMNWRKSTKKHSAKIREENRRWKLWFELRHGPTFFHSLQNHSSESKANVSLSLNFAHYARLAIMWNLPTLRFL